MRPAVTSCRPSLATTPYATPPDTRPIVSECPWSRPVLKPRLDFHPMAMCTPVLAALSGESEDQAIVSLISNALGGALPRSARAAFLKRNYLIPQSEEKHRATIG